MSQEALWQLKGSAVRRLRQRLHLTQAELGLVLGMRQPYVSDLERGVYTAVRTPTLAALAEALGVTMEELVWEEERHGGG